MQNGSFYKLSNTIQDYPWGSKTSINELFGIPNPKNEPQAEIWMGAHPKASSTIIVDGESIALSEYLTANGEQALGLTTLNHYGELPYLFKVLAAGEALSIQVHPNKQEAEQGYALENSRGIALDAFNRNYKDANHKPELVFALTPYQAMNGFRPFADILLNFEKLDAPSLAETVADFASDLSPQGLQTLFRAVLSLENEQKIAAIAELLSWCDRHHNNEPLAALIIDLNTIYPNDVGLFAPLLLNVVTLQPGQAMFLDAGTPHAYIHGTGLELMANSDNVLRAGLTPKYMDIDELISCCRFAPLANDKILTAPEINGCELRFPVPVDDFAFAIYQKPKTETIEQQRAEIWFAVETDVQFSDINGNQITLAKGESVFIPYSTKTFTVTSDGVVARAY
ncbi:mannose-6-phosphate isomerase, class I [Vibrio sp. SM6]|uniref:mannose-6-phosphate isomerase n=1 Tax=Vibrio agarilyticus TaxID=2726741 RepID=A0A7X8TQQ7_9VIBR|nr:mannose-6-phosphate isomerase, class I [Vibrio agarilyticus]NLS12508.1 mannose-6-phosphate isomerase, class I [Vibrio agarilyticus]